MTGTVSVVERVAGRDLVESELALLSAVLTRRDPQIATVVDRMELAPLTHAERERVRRAVVDELCELPKDGHDRRALELEEILIYLGTA